MKWTTGLIVSAMLLAAACHADSKTERDIHRSVVRLSASQRYPNLLKPWRKDNPPEVAGTGVVLDGQRLLTNAHLVVYAKQIYGQSTRSSDKLAATVERIAPSIDLPCSRHTRQAIGNNGVVQECYLYGGPQP